RLVKRDRRRGAEARTSRTVRSPGHHSLPAAGLERYHYLRLPRICHPELEPMASRDRGRPLLARHALSCLAAPALSKRDLAWFCPPRGKLPLFGRIPPGRSPTPREVRARESEMPARRRTSAR